MLNFLSIAEAISMRGGAHLMEHPQDPGEDPYPSIWNTDQGQVVETKTGAARCLFDQCPFGAPTKKATCVSTTIPGFPEEGPRCTCFRHNQLRDTRCGHPTEESQERTNSIDA